MTARASAIVGVAAVALAVAACAQEVPRPLPFANVTVDTNVDVPRAASRLRIDLYGSDGRWIHSRDYPLAQPRDWPASFGVVAPEDRETTVLLRARAYVDGAARDYRGERADVRPVFEPRKVPTTLGELCDAPPLLEERVAKTLRLGPDEIIESKGCAFGSGSGAVAAKVTIPKAGRYRFEVVRIAPDAVVSPVLMLRRSCMDVATEVACDAPRQAGVERPARLIATLSPGDYTLLVADGFSFNRDDVTLRWAADEDWTLPDARTTAPPAEPPPPTDRPRLVVEDRDSTPTAEPSPDATTESLVRLRLVPGAPLTARLLLDGACLGKPAGLVIRADGTVDVEASTSCIAGESTKAPLAAPADATFVATSEGTFPADAACRAEDTTERVVCIPGGTFLLGAVETDLSSLADPSVRTLPRRAVALSRFYLDRYELTVGRYRQAIARGFTSKTSDRPFENEQTLGPTSSSDPFRLATFSVTPRGREAYPLNEVSWDRAREICRFYGGDLPTEAQWEYAAVAAGRVAKASYPWGGAEPTCAHAIYGRDPTITQESCPGRPFGPRPVDDPDGALDVTPLGVAGMAGNVREWVRDAHEPYDAPCWSAVSARDPACVDDTSPWRTTRGNSWEYPRPLLRSAYRGKQRAAGPSFGLGFRCAYKKPPVKTWEGP